MKRQRVELDIEKDMTELTIGADGRVFAFGTSRGVLEVLCAVAPQDQRVRRMLEQVRAREARVNELKQTVTGDVG